MPTSDSHSKQSPLFYPINIDVVGRKTFVFGGTNEALLEVTKLLDFGASVDLVAPQLMAEILELGAVYGERIKISRREFDNSDRKKISDKAYILVFALARDDARNKQVVEAATAADVLVFGINQARNSSFITPSGMKRGHLKINVSSDGVSQAYERAILNRIEASFVSQIDKYVLFLDRLNEKLIGLNSDPAFRTELAYNSVTRHLYNSEEIFLALQRQSFDEADSIVERIIANHKVPQTELA